MPLEEFPMPFETLAVGIGMGTLPPDGWQSIADCSLVIVVGVTGVGKSAMLDSLAQMGTAFTIVPDRRTLTDKLIITRMQIADGLPVAPLRDRKQRFEMTRRFRTDHPGGLAEVVAQLWVFPEAVAPLLVFDGLRGANEVVYAAAHLPRARFVMLDAPDWVRVQRLLGRSDVFDTITAVQSSTSELAQDMPLRVPGVESLFTSAELSTMLEWVHRGAISLDDLRAKLLIVAEERKNYDPSTTLDVFREVAAERTLYVDTAAQTAQEIAAQVANWLCV